MFLIFFGPENLMYVLIIDSKTLLLSVRYLLVYFIDVGFLKDNKVVILSLWIFPCIVEIPFLHKWKKSLVFLWVWICIAIYNSVKLTALYLR